MRPWLAAAALVSACPAWAATPERLSIVANGEIVGTVVATTAGRHVSVDYRVDDNGRGPKHREEIELGSDGLPVSWTIAGTSLMGGPVAESYRWAGGRATWRSQADKGDAPAAVPPLYVVNDDSPWATGVYARAALAKGGSIAVLPGGRLTVTKLRDMHVGTTPVTVYRLTGIQLAPQYLMLDPAKHLFASFGATGVAIRAGFEQQAAILTGLATQLENERVRAISGRVAHRFDTPVRIRKVRIFDPQRGSRSGLSTVVVMRDRITRILPGDGGTVPPGEAVIEGEGGTLYPGLADMHSHTTVDSGLFYLAAGVTLTRDMGNDNTFLQGLLPLIDSGTVAGPRIVVNGFIEGRSPYSARLGFVVGSLPEAIDAVHWYADRGYFEIKLYNSFDPAWVNPVTTEAHRLGMGVTGHVPAFDTPDRAIADGYDTIAHVNQLMLGWLLDPAEDTRTPLRLTGMARAADLDLTSPRVRRTVDLMVAHHTALDTTAVILERLMLSRASQVAAGDADYLSHMPIGYQRYRSRTFVPLKDAVEDARYRAAFDKVLQTLKMLHSAGIRLLPGTDDVTGFTAQREVVLYVQAGIPPAQALRLATLGAAEYLRLDHDRGTIEPGKLADFVLVPGDPVQDITAIRRPRLVAHAGAFYYPAEIYRELGIEPFAFPPTLIPARPVATRAAGSPVGAAYFGADGLGD